MKASQLLAVAAAVGSVAAVPSGPVAKRVESISKSELQQLHARQEGAKGADGIVSLIMLIEDLIRNNHNAYDDDIDSQMCDIVMTTYAGGDCRAYIACGGDQQWPDPKYPTVVPGPGDGEGGGWNVCYLNGVQYFTYPQFGDFSIEFTQAGGVNGNTQDGLHNPILKSANIGNWEAIDVQAQSDRVLTQSSGNICTRVGEGDHQLLAWKCGLPMIGSQYLNYSNNPAVSATSYAAGTCGIHFIDYQIPSGDDQYYVALRIVDNNGVMIGEVGNSHSVGEDRVSAANPVNIDSLLPWVLIYTRHGPDSAVPHFDYANDHWDATPPRCSVGGFDSGARQGDCSFAC